jgi:4-amino-4-deoxy-L-arabinose transferase-like glycosyltransferase
VGSAPLRSVLAIALVLRATAAFVHAAQGPGPSALFDERPFFLVARALAEEGRFATRPGGPPDVIRGPAYPAFLVPFVAVAGATVLGPALAQAVLGTATVWIVAGALQRRLRREGAPEPPATSAVRLAAWAMALSPIAIVWDRFVMSESLATFLLAATVALSWEAAQGERPLAAALASGACGAALVLAKPAFVVLLPALALLAARGGRPLAAVALTGAAAALLLPWTLRNAQVADRASPAGLGSGLFLYAATLPRASDGVPVFEEPRARATVERYLDYDTPVTERVTADADLRHRALERIRARPLAYVASWVPRGIRLWVSSHAEALRPLHLPRPVRVVIALGFGTVALTALSALALPAGPLRRTALALAVVPAYVTLVHLPLASGSRYSVPAWPFVWSLAALAVSARLGLRTSGGAPALETPS